MDNSSIAGDIVEMARGGSVQSATDSVRKILDEMNLMFSAEHNAIVASPSGKPDKFLNDHRVFLLKLINDYGEDFLGGKRVVLGCSEQKIFFVRGDAV
jgi:hypothetical protein